MLPARLRHQQSRYIFQAVWFAVFFALLLNNAPPQAWIGLLAAALLSSLLVKRAACSFVCPLFPIGELLWRSGEKLFGRTFAPPFWFDLVLRSGKYLLLAGLAWGYFHGSAPMQQAAPLPVLLAALLVLGLFFQMPWCRYLCPAGALFGLASLASLGKIRRTPRHCVRCHKCSHRCPASLPVMQLTTVRSAECFACYRCVNGCPAPAALDFAAPGNRVIPAWLTGIVAGTILLAGLLAGFVS